MQTLVVDIDKGSTLHLLYGLSKKLGLRPHIIRNKKKTMSGFNVPTGSAINGKYYSAEKYAILQNIIRGMVEMMLVEKGVIKSRPVKQFLNEL